ncbi:uncharacterized protein O3C94_010854 [Discoglossus pictus]
MEEVTTCDYLKLEKHMEPEDLVNNNKETIQQDGFTNQAIVGDTTKKGKQQSTAGIHNEFLFTSMLKDGDSVTSQGTFYPVRDSTTFSENIKEDLDKKAHNKEQRYKTKDDMRRVIDIAANNERRSSGDENNCGTLNDEIETLSSELDLLNLQEFPEDQGKTNRMNSRLDQNQKENEIIKVYGVFNHKTIPTSDKSDEVQSTSADADIFDEYDTNINMPDIDDDMDPSTEPHGHFHRRSLKTQDILDELCNNQHSVDSETTSAESMKKYKFYTQIKQGDLETDKELSPENLKEPNMEYLGLMVSNTSKQDEKDNRLSSFIIPNKLTEMSFQKNQKCKKEKEREEHWPLCDLFGRKSIPLDSTEIISEELDVVAEENDSEKDESEEETDDGFINYCSSQDRIDPIKERQRYVSDKLDPDVLQLLEMHLRKQQLVDIKEEREEELLDLHINKEKPRTESFKGFRNIPPVLDMVLEEPELEHTGDILEEENQTPSDVDSDDSNNICAMEMGLIESLQCDLLSKTNKIDKNEIATIFKQTNTDGLLKGHQEDENPQLQYKLQNNHNDGIKNALTNTSDKMQHPQNVVDHCPLTNMVLDNNVYDVRIQPMENNLHDPVTFVESEDSIYNVGTQSKKDIPDALKKSEEQPTAHDDAVCLVGESIITQPVTSVPCYPQFNGKKVDLGSSVDEINDNSTTHNSKEAPIMGNNDLTQYMEEPLCERETDVQDTLSKNIIKVEWSSGGEAMMCSDVERNEKPCNPSIYEGTKQKETLLHQSGHGFDEHCPSANRDLLSESLPVEPYDGVEEPEKVPSTNSLILMKPKDEFPEDNSLPGSSSDETKTLRISLEQRLIYLLEKAKAADCRSSRLQAEAELLWKESRELRNECKNLSKEAAEILSILSQQEEVPRNRTEQSVIMKTRGGGESSGTNDTTEINEKTLICCDEATTNGARRRRKGEDQLQLLRRKYSFLREEAPDVIRELNSLQKDLKSLPHLYNTPMRVLNSLLWGGLITGGTMLLLWWSNKQIG